MKHRLAQSKFNVFAILAVLIIGYLIVVLNRNHILFNSQKTAQIADIENANRLVFSGDYQRVVDSLAKSSFANKDEEIDGRAALAKSYFGLKKYNQSIEQFLIILPLETDLLAKSNTDNLLANAYRDSGDITNARKYYQEAVSNNSKNSQAWVNYAYMEYAQNDKDKALEIINSAGQALPADPSIKSAAQRLKL